MSEYVKRGEEHESNNSKLTPSYSNIFLYFKWKTQITRMESPPKLLNVGEKRERESWADWQFSPDTQKVTPQNGPAS